MGWLRNAGTGGGDEEDRVGAFVARHVAGRRKGEVDEAGGLELTAEHGAVEAVVELALDVGRVEGAVLDVEIGERDPPTGHEVVMQRPQQRRRVLHMVQPVGRTGALSAELSRAAFGSDQP
jgi:hypothetical protein